MERDPGDERHRSGAGPDGRTAGRRIPDPGYAGDRGDADPALSAAMRAWADDAARRPEVLAALHRSRVLAPVVALPGETDAGPTGLVVDRTADIALPLLDDGAGHRAVPVFSSLEAMTRWDPQARPVPVDGRRAAAVALAEGAEGLVLDVAGPHPVVLGPAELRALVDGRGAVPAYDDDDLHALLSGALAAEPGVRGAWIRPAVGVDARLRLALAPGADPAEIGRRVGQRLRSLIDRSVHGIDVELAEVVSVTGFSDADSADTAFPALGRVLVASRATHRGVSYPGAQAETTSHPHRPSGPPDDRPSGPGQAGSPSGGRSV